MQLTLKEIAYLAERIGDYNFLSPFYNIKEQPDGSVVEKLTEKKILSGAAVTPKSQECIAVLARPDCASSILLFSGYASLKMYSYKKGGEVYLAENVKDEQLRISKPENWAKTLYKFSEFIGTSSLLNVTIKVTLSEQEILVLAAMVDLHRKNALAGYIDQAVPFKCISLSSIKEELAAGYKNGLLRLIAANYDLEIPESAIVESVLDSLLKRECLTKEENVYQLTTSYVLFARNFLIPHTQVLLETFRYIDEKKVVKGRFLAIAAGLHDILGLFYDGESFEMKTINAVSLLYMIETYLNCPDQKLYEAKNNMADGSKESAGDKVDPDKEDTLSPHGNGYEDESEIQASQEQALTGLQAVNQADSGSAPNPAPPPLPHPPIPVQSASAPPPPPPQPSNFRLCNHCGMQTSLVTQFCEQCGGKQ